MEQKRILWIIAAVGVFLLVVLGAALILYSPQARSAQTIASYSSSSKNNTSNGWISLTPSTVPVHPQEFEKPFAEEETSGFIPEGAPREFNGEADKNFPPRNHGFERPNHVGEIVVYTDNITVNGNQVAQSTSGEPQTIINNTTTIDLNPAPVRPKVETVRKFNNERPAVKNVEKAAPASKAVQKAPAAKPAAPAKEITQFWVQVTALTSRKSADDARSVLADNKISADVFTYEDGKGSLFYRVRVGPYMTKSEAEYWKAKISKIDAFKNTESFVASTKVSQ